MALTKAEHARLYDERNREKRRLAAKARRLANPERDREINRRSRLKHLERARARVRAWCAANKEKRAEHQRRNRAHNTEKMREWRAANPGRVKEIARRCYRKNGKRRMAEWRAANPEKVAAALKRRNKDKARAALARWRASPKGKINGNVRRRIRHWLGTGGRPGGLAEVLGYTVAELRAHLERQFTKGMSWDNYGQRGWHIDHIIPMSSFKIASPNDPNIARAWALTNLRPLWARDNLSKWAHVRTLL